MKFLETREDIKQKSSVKTNKEKEILDILKAEKVQIALGDFEKLLIDVQEIPDFNTSLIETGKKVLKNLKIHSLSERM